MKTPDRRTSMVFGRIAVSAGRFPNRNNCEAWASVMTQRQSARNHSANDEYCTGICRAHNEKGQPEGCPFVQRGESEGSLNSALRRNCPRACKGKPVELPELVGSSVDCTLIRTHAPGLPPIEKRQLTEAPLLSETEKIQ